MDILIKREQNYSAPNHSPLPLVLAKGSGCFVWDTKGKQYLDCSSSLMVNNFGHCHPKIVQAAKIQLARLTMTSRLFYNDQLPGLLEQACQLTQICLLYTSPSPRDA